jgi:hypothetical protein
MPATRREREYRRMVELTIPAVIDADDGRAAVEAIEEYFGRGEGQVPYTGASFDRLGGGGDRAAVANEITAEDLVAVSMLSVYVPPRAALRILIDQRAEITAMLEQIPTDLCLGDVSAAHIVPDWPPWQLSRLLRRHDGVGPVISSKILARKRPHLLPVYDDVVRVQYQLVDDTGFWAAMARALNADDRAVYHRLHAIRDKAAVADISVLRVLDIATWISGRGGARRR